MTIKKQEAYIRTRLKQEREKRGMSQLELALSAGLSQNMIAYLETGKRAPTLTTILKICAALKISPGSIFPKTVDSKKEAKSTVLRLVEEFM